jgi:hypothetical protein
MLYDRNQHRVYILHLCSCLYRSHRRHRDVERYRINIVSTLWTFFLVYIVHIVDIAMLNNIESTSCRHCIPFFLFASFTSSTSQCCTISNQHRVYIVNLCSCYTSFTSSTSWCCTISNQHHVYIVNLSWDPIGNKPLNWRIWRKNNQVMFLYISIICYLTVFICVFLFYKEL